MFDITTPQLIYCQPFNMYYQNLLHHKGSILIRFCFNLGWQWQNNTQCIKRLTCADHGLCESDLNGSASWIIELTPHFFANKLRIDLHGPSRIAIPSNSSKEKLHSCGIKKLNFGGKKKSHHEEKYYFMHVFLMIRGIKFKSLKYCFFFNLNI